jgi:nodulation protein E
LRRSGARRDMQRGRRVVVTGAGILCGLGNCADDCWRALCEGRTGIAPIQSVDMRGLRFQNGAEVRSFRAEEHFDAARCEMMDRFAQLAVVAARQAVSQAGYESARIGGSTHICLKQADMVRQTEAGYDSLGAGQASADAFALDKASIAVVTGTSMGGQTSLDRGFAAIYKEGRPRPHPFTIPLTMYNAGASQIAMEMGITGPAFSIVTACASATHAIGQAFWMVRSGAAEAAICGGSEAPFSPGILRAWEAMRVVTPEVCRPFSRDRKGLTLGEGAAMLFLETAERAESRGAQVLGEVAGFGMSSDAGHLTLPSVDGPATAMSAALADAGMADEEVDYINAHGTGTRANDATETQAIRRLFGAHAEKMAISSTKSMHGHALGATGALEAFATLMALRCGVLPPTANFTEADPECDLDVIPNIARHREIAAALSNSFAFGGLNAVLALRRWEAN